MNNESKIVKKKSTTLAWIALLVLLTAAGALSYLKFFANIEPNPTQEEPKQETSSVVTEALTTIVNNFNSNKEIAELEKNNIKISAKVNKEEIDITYIEKEPKIYNFSLNVPNLKITTETNDKEFEKVFSILVYATQKRLNNEKNIDKYINDFLQDEKEVEGLYKEPKEANEIEYSIDIGKIIGEEETTENQTDNSQDKKEGE